LFDELGANIFEMSNSVHLGATKKRNFCRAACTHKLQFHPLIMRLSTPSSSGLQVWRGTLAGNQLGRKSIWNLKSQVTTVTGNGTEIRTPPSRDSKIRSEDVSLHALTKHPRVINSMPQTPSSRKSESKHIREREFQAPVNWLPWYPRNEDFGSLEAFPGSDGIWPEEWCCHRLKSFNFWE